MPLQARVRIGRALAWVLTLGAVTACSHGVPPHDAEHVGDRVALANESFGFRVGASAKTAAVLWVDGKRVNVPMPEAARKLSIERLEPVGFVRDRAIFAGVAGAHGHTWAVISIDIASGEGRAVACSVCDSVVVSARDVFAVGSLALKVHRWSADLRDHKVTRLPASRIDRPHPEFGDPPPYAAIVAADGSDAFVATRRVGDRRRADRLWNAETRIVRVPASGKPVWSPTMNSIAPHSGDVTANGNSLVVSGFGPAGMTVLDRDTLRVKGSFALPAKEFDPDTLVAASPTSVYLAGVPCTECDADLVQLTWDGHRWTTLTPPDGKLIVCAGAPPSGLRVVRTVTDPDVRPPDSIVQRRVKGAWRNVGRVPPDACVIG